MFFFSSVHRVNYLFSSTVSKENEALIQFTTVFSHPTEHKMKCNELLMPPVSRTRCIWSSWLNHSCELLSPKRHRRQQPVHPVHGFWVQFGDKPTGRVPHGGAGRGFGGCLGGELAKFGRSQAGTLLGRCSKAISHQLQRNQPGNFFTASLRWYQNSGQMQLLLRIFATDPWGGGFEGLWI